MRRTPFGLPVLPDVYWMKAGSEESPSGAGHEAPTAMSSAALVTSPEGRHPGAQEAGHTRGPGNRDQNADLGIGQDRRLPERVLLEAVEASGRVDRDRNGARDQDPLEDPEEIDARGEHEGHGVPLAHAALAEAAGYGGRIGPQPAVRDLGLDAVVLADVGLYAVGIGRGASPERLVDGRVAASNRRRLAIRRRPLRDRGRGRSALGGQRASQLGRRVDGEGRVVEAAPQDGLEAKHQLDALEASEADVPLEGRPWRHGPFGPLTPELAGEAADDVEDEVLEVGAGLDHEPL